MGVRWAQWRMSQPVLSETAMLAAVVTTLLYVPVCGLLALLCFTAWGVSLSAFVTLGGTYPAYVGVLVWWVILFVPAFAYATLLPPWKSGGYFGRR
jgi:hypothetical protein